MPSVRLQFLPIPMSVLLIGGPENTFLGLVPNVPPGLLVKAAVLKYELSQLLLPPWRTLKDWPETTFARSAACSDPELLLPLPPRTVIGVPDCEVTMALTCQLPNTCRNSAFLLENDGVV